MFQYFCMGQDAPFDGTKTFLDYQYKLKLTDWPTDRPTLELFDFWNWEEYSGSHVGEERNDESRICFWTAAFDVVAELYL